MDSRPYPLASPDLLQSIGDLPAAAPPRPLPYPGWHAVLALCAVLAAPLALVDVPPILDYPNHLARAYLLANGARHAGFADFFRPLWTVLPNLGTDLILVPLLRALPDTPAAVHAAGRLLLAVIILLPVLGAIAYSRAVFHRASWWPFAAGLVAYNAAMLQGFLNFTAAIGLALLAAALWRLQRQARPARTILLAATASAGLFLVHMMGLGFFLLLIAAAELEWAWRRTRHLQRAAPGQVALPGALARALLPRILACVPILVPPALLYALSPLAAIEAAPNWLTPGEKFANLLVPFVNYSLPLDLLTAAILVLLLAACAACGRLRAPFASVVALLCLAVLYVCAPFDFKGTAALDMRFAILAALLVFAGLLPSPAPRLLRAAAVLLATLFAVRMAVLALVWHGHNTDLAQLRATMAGVPPGSRVFLTSIGPPDAVEYWRRSPAGRHLSNGTRTDYHLAALLVIERQSIWPYLFANPSQQPIEVTPRYNDLADQTFLLPDTEFAAICRAPTPPADTSRIDQALCGYDYVLLFEAGALPALDGCGAGRLRLVHQTEFAALFRVQPLACRMTVLGLAK